MSAGPQSFIDQELARFRDELFDFLRIPSVSADSAHDADTRKAAEWLQARMTEAGLTTEICETPGHPVVLGKWLDAGPEAPTILIYGHYDVQPSVPDELWTSPAFEPEIRDGRIYARGSADDKGQLFLHVKAIEAHLKTNGALPVNVILLAEGEEEVGSPNLLPFLKANAGALSCDAVVISDSAMFAPGVPSLLFSLRGLAYFEVRIEGPTSDLHSGAYGGAVPNPANALSQLIASFHDENGRIAIDGFYDDVVAWDTDTRTGIANLPFDEDDFRDSVGAASLSGEDGYSALERLWVRPSCDVNGLASGYQGEGAKTVLPSYAMAKVSFRLVPNQDPDKVGDLFRAHVEAHTPKGVRCSIEELHGGRPWRGQTEGKLFEAASVALQKSFGAAPVFTGEGGSIPIVVEFEEVLEAPALLIGFALPGCNMHAPDEWLAVENFENGVRAISYLFDELAG